MERRTALVTGAAKGIGAAIVKKLADNGYAVIINYRNSEDAALKLVGELQKKEVNCAAYKADLSIRCEAENMYYWAKKCFGFVDTVVNNAGVCHFSLATQDGEDEYERVMGCNFKSMYNVCGLFARDMINECRGNIVNISSVWGKRGASMESLYSASKSAVIGYTKALAKELAPENIKVNCVLPGYIATDMNARFSDDEQAAILKSMRQKTILYPSDVASVVLSAIQSEKSGKLFNVI